MSLSLACTTGPFACIIRPGSWSTAVTSKSDLPSLLFRPCGPSSNVVTRDSTCSSLSPIS